jgi:hypothetical protein
MGVDGLTLPRLEAIEPHEQVPAAEEIDLRCLAAVEGDGIDDRAKKGVRMVHHSLLVTHHSSLVTLHAHSHRTRSAW